MVKINDDIKRLLKSPEYLAKKLINEKNYFKLNGKYCMYRNEIVSHQTVSDIAEYFKNDQITTSYTKYIDEDTSKKVTISASFYDIWSFDPNIRTYHSIVFDCDVANVPNDCFNLFDGFHHFDHLEKKVMDLEPIFEHIKTLVGYNAEMFEYYINFNAQLVQQPHLLPHTVPVFISDQGIGKDKWFNFNEKVIGEKYCCTVDKLELIVGDFNGSLGGKLLLNVNETDPIESKKREDSIKFVTTAEKVVINEKYEKPIKGKNFARFNWWSNKPFAFPMEAGARRPRINKSSNKYIDLSDDEKNVYFSKLIKILADENYQYAFLRYLQEKDISSYNFQKPIVTDFQLELEKHSAPVLATFLSNKVHNQIIDVQTYGSTVLFKQFGTYLKNNNYKYELDTKKFKFELVNTYGLTHYNSNGIASYKIQKTHLTTLLQTKYKINFDEIGVEDHEYCEADDNIEYLTIIKQLREEIRILKHAQNDSSFSNAVNNLMESNDDRITIDIFRTSNTEMHKESKKLDSDHDDEVHNKPKKKSKDSKSKLSTADALKNIGLC